MPYRQNLNEARQDASREFFMVHNSYAELVETICELTFQCVSDTESRFKLTKYQHSLLARLYELEDKDLEDLTGQAPNVRELQSTLNRIYSKYSDGAHSATYGSMALLGFYEERKRREHIWYPEFTENTEIIFQNWIFVFFEFSLWIMTFKNDRLTDYGKAEDENKFQEVMTLYKQSGLDRKFRGNPGD